MQLQLTDEQKKWLDVLRLKGSEKKRQEEIDNIANPVRRWDTCSHEQNTQMMCSELLQNNFIVFQIIGMD